MSNRKKTPKRKIESTIISHNHKAWFTFVSGILMFLSWCFQEIYLSDINSKKEQISQNATFITSESSIALQWMLKYQEEIKKPNYDIDTIANTSRGYLVAMSKILETATWINPESTILKEHLIMFNKYVNQYNIYYKSKNVKMMVMTTLAVMEFIRYIYPKADTELKKALYEISEKDDFYTIIFRIFYIISSILFGYAWLSDNYRKN